MVGLLGREQFEKLCALELFRIRSVIWIDRGLHRERVESCRFAIVGKGLVKFLHGFLIGHRPSRMILLIEAFIERRDGFDVAALPRRLLSNATGLIHSGLPLL